MVEHDVLRASDGSLITTPQQWTVRRLELLNLFQDQMYGAVARGR